uniref:RNA polymerase II-associated protein 1 C-terminal domain-containing protein n=1 Tax=Hyaloperonospora arabidopsidis (strain Emoy2) TaxID=559515 RepID=M4BEN2_HYAAE
MDAELAQLVHEQEQFLQQRKRPSATVTRCTTAPSGASASRSTPKESESTGSSSVQVLKGVVERHVTLSVGPNERLLLSGLNPKNPLGFPSVARRGVGDDNKRGIGRPKNPLFGRQRRAAQQSADKSFINEEMRAIDVANRARVQDMSAQEVQEAQQELEQTLDAKLIAKLRNRRKTGEDKEGLNSTEKARHLTKKEGGEEGVGGREEEEAVTREMDKKQRMQKLAAVRTDEELQEQVELLPLDERAKLEWTQSQKLTARDNKSRGRIGARRFADATLERFDLDGKLLEATDAELPVHSGLFHHGDDPEAAGYTVPELLHLARSTVASQRAMSLQIVAKILHRRQVLANASLHLVPQILPRDMAMTLRVVLDDQNYTALGAGLSALHAFVVPVDTDDCLLDKRLYPELTLGTVVLPPRVHLHRNGEGTRTNSEDHDVYDAEEVVYIDTTEADDGSSISDEDIAALDPVQALLSMDLDKRLCYILETIQLPDQNATEKMLEILITVARHSPRAAHEISSNARLLRLLQQQYIESEQVLTFQEGNARSLRLSLKALQLVRGLCQGQRSIASALIANGLVQSTKGFLALKNMSTDETDLEAVALFGDMQVESLRIWRILLGYGLDFHCFAYLFPVLSGFTHSYSEASSSRNSALFAALEAFCGLGAVHEAQHYFSQLGFFVDAAKDEFVRIIRSPSLSKDHTTVVLLSTVLRFLSAASTHATKYNLETSGLMEVWKLVQLHDVTRKLLPQLDETVAKRDLLLAIVRFHGQIVANGLLPDDMDDDEIVQTFLREVKAPLLAAATCAVASSSFTFSFASIQACELTLLSGDLIAAGENVIANSDLEFVQNVYRQALILMERLGCGGEHLITHLFAQVLFHKRVLLLLGVFHEEADAARLSRVLVPIYQALVNVTHEQEEHYAHIFGGASTAKRFSYHLRLPQEEQTFTHSSLPLPNFWMLCPLSRIEYCNSGEGRGLDDVNLTRAQSDEVKLILSATCRYVFELERLAPQMTFVASIAKLQPEDKLFHLMHVFFAGSDVLFDDHVDAALRQLLPKLVQPILRSPGDSRDLYKGVLRNFKRIESLEFGKTNEPSVSQKAVSFTSDERQVMTFVEKLVCEFTTSSYGNSHFARCVTLLLARDFSLELRKFVWQELHESHLLHTLAPFEVSSSQQFMRCTRGGTTPAVDAKLLQLMQQAVCKNQVSPARGAFAYSLAIHHLVVYLFEERGDNPLTSARQHVAQTLTAEASLAIWGHLLSYDASKNSSMLTSEYEDPLPGRVMKVQTQAALSMDQLSSFETTVSELIASCIMK